MWSLGKKEDLVSLLTGNINAVLGKLMFVGVVFLLISHFLGTATFTKGFAISLGVAYCDMLIFLWGLKKAFRYAANPRQGLWVFHKYTFLRLVNISVMFYLLSRVIRLKDYASGLCIGFLLLHILLILYLIFVTHRMNKTGA